MMTLFCPLKDWNFWSLKTQMTVNCTFDPDSMALNSNVVPVTGFQKQVEFIYGSIVVLSLILFSHVMMKTEMKNASLTLKPNQQLIILR